MTIYRLGCEARQWGRTVTLRVCVQSSVCEVFGSLLLLHFLKHALPPSELAVLLTVRVYIGKIHVVCEDCLRSVYAEWLNSNPPVAVLRANGASRLPPETSTQMVWAVRGKVYDSSAVFGSRLPHGAFWFYGCSYRLFTGLVDSVMHLYRIESWITVNPVPVWVTQWISFVFYWHFPPAAFLWTSFG